MAVRPVIYVSAVSVELSSARQVVAAALGALGYEAAWDEIADGDHTDQRHFFQRHIEASTALIQLIGRCYGSEPPLSARPGGRTSYAQTEAQYARQCGKPVWYLVLDRAFPTEPHPPEPKELRALQAAYIRRVRAFRKQFHLIHDEAALTARIHALRDEFDPRRRSAPVWFAGVAVFVALSIGLSVWFIQHRHEVLRRIFDDPPTTPTMTVDPSRN